MLLGALKAAPAAAVVGAVSVKNLAVYAGIASMVAAILVVGALWSAAKAWRERAEARTDEAEQLEARVKRQDEKIAKLEGRIVELSKRPDLSEIRADVREVRTADAAEHNAIIASIDRLSGQFGAALDRNTGALETIGKHIPWDAITSPKEGAP